MSLYQHVPHPHIARRRAEGPTTVAEQAQGFNGKLAVKITAVVGTMVCAYLFTALALISLPGALKSGDAVIIVAWIAQTFIQLVLLPIIIVGQNIQAKASDKRAEQTYLDAEAVLHEAQQIQAHLAAQDAAIEAIATKAGIAVVSIAGVPPASGATAQAWAHPEAGQSHT